MYIAKPKVLFLLGALATALACSPKAEEVGGGSTGGRSAGGNAGSSSSGSGGNPGNKGGGGNVSGGGGGSNQGGSGGAGNSGSGGDNGSSGGAGDSTDAGQSPGAGGSGGDPDASASCSSFCPALFKLAAACAPDNMCTVATSMAGDATNLKLCNGNGIKQEISTTENPDTGAFTQTVKVLTSGGAVCYTIDVMGDDAGTTRTWKDPSGAVIGTGKSTDDVDSITCDGKMSDIPDGSNCPWVSEGPDDGDCMEGACN